MPYTQYRRFSVQAGASNSGVWGAGGTTGDDLNTGVMGPLDYMLGGITTFSVSGATVALDFTAGGGGAVQNAMWRFTGALVQSAVISPNAGNATTYLTGTYYWENITTGAYTLTLTTGTGSVVLPQGRRGCVFIDGTNAPRITGIAGSSTADPIPAGTSMLFKQAAAPSGYTQVTSLNNYALRLVSGTGAGTGGSTGFTSVFTSRTPAGSVSAPTVDIPAAGYTGSGAAPVGVGALAISAAGAGGVGGGYAWMTTARTLTATVPTFTGTAMDFAVNYVDLINATRD